jgi:hypothetical protein
MRKITRIGKVLVGITGHEGLSWVWHLVKVSHGFEKSWQELQGVGVWVNIFFSVFRK